MKILETNYLTLVQCKVENDDGNILDKVFLIDTKSDNVFELDVNLKKTDQETSFGLMEKYKNFNYSGKQMSISELIGQSVPTMEDIQKMIMEQQNDIPMEKF